jgi:hypothetical protein
MKAPKMTKKTFSAKSIMLQISWDLLYKIGHPTYETTKLLFDRRDKMVQRMNLRSIIQGFYHEKIIGN